MKPMTLLQAMGDIPDEYIESALPGRQKKEKGKVISFFRRREFMGLAAAALLLILAFTLAPGLLRPAEDPGQEQVTNPFVTYQSLEEAQEAAGFTLSVPESFEGAGRREIAVIDGRIIDVTYLDGEDNRVLTIRKGTGEEDISGDYNEYPQEDVTELEGLSVTVRGDGKRIFLALWQEEGYSYAVSFDKGGTQDQLKEIMKTVMRQVSE
jgi:hypothetical protein